jgi:hypothetical protein
MVGALLVQEKILKIRFKIINFKTYLAADDQSHVDLTWPDCPKGTYQLDMDFDFLLFVNRFGISPLNILCNLSLWVRIRWDNVILNRLPAIRDDGTGSHQDCLK